jgi:hypothetical protein
MHGGEAFVFVTMFAGFFAMVFGIYYLRTKENLAMVEKGMNPKEKINRPAPFRSLKWGLLLLGAGLGLLTAFIVDASIFSYDDSYRHRDSIPALYFSLIGIGGGLGLVVSYIVEKKYWYDKNGTE